MVRRSLCKGIKRVIEQKLMKERKGTKEKSFFNSLKRAHCGMEKSFFIICRTVILPPSSKILLMWYIQMCSAQSLISINIGNMQFARVSLAPNNYERIQQSISIPETASRVKVQFIYTNSNSTSAQFLWGLLTVLTVLSFSDIQVCCICVLIL